MINTPKLVKLFLKKKINFFSGVPDSCTNEFCNELKNFKSKVENIVTANEGLAVSTGLGYYLSQNKIPCIYMQNSGLGNATDPLTNLCNKDVYRIPMILMIGWRGAPGIQDEAQHIIQGKILKKTLKSFQIRFLEINYDNDFYKIEKLINYAKKNSRCVALLVKKNSLSKSNFIKKIPKNNFTLKRSEIITNLLKNIEKKTKIISSVGFNSRELFQIRKQLKFKNGKDFLLVGGMGHTFSTAMIVSKNTNEKVICLDGDGSFIMHLGSFVIMNNYKLNNLKYILIDNSSHESIGGQEITTKINFKYLTKSFGFKNYYFINSEVKLNEVFKKFLNKNGPSFLHAKVKVGTLNNLVRPKDFQRILKDFKKNF
ncbi:phosphonopyruvate decarboxylase [Candidatus Pelagibacter sp.]|nr:phosphonopyruvate decarboxylase [Candidatus Pelagibacter sp.]